MPTDLESTLMVISLVGNKLKIYKTTIMFITTFKKLEDNTIVMISQEPLNEPSLEQLIADKEAQLLAIYEELQALKG